LEDKETWKVILAIHQYFLRCQENIDFIAVNYSRGQNEILCNLLGNHTDFIISFKQQSKIQSIAEFYATEPLALTSINSDYLPQDVYKVFQLYIPYAILPYFAKKLKKCFAISHFAQTLDGRIASTSGNSKWIGNKENLVHAHKMRALCDAILIGAGTLYKDNPKLNVRLVEGQDPIKVVLGNVRAKAKQYNAIDESTIVIKRNNTEESLSNCQEILDSLYKKGIYSVYIEGGAKTTSSFLKAGTIAQVQIHISAKIIGAGIEAFSFNGISDIDKSIKFTISKFVNIGEEIMFIGNLK
jgi:riboflavin-specific deaminase-like protein